MNEMDQKDARIEAMIRDHFHEALDGHVGDASRRFAEQLSSSREKVIAFPAEAARGRSSRSMRSDGPRFGSLWTIGLVGAALAATVTIVSLRHTMPTPTGSTPSPRREFANPPQNGITGPENVVPADFTGERNLAFQTQDQGIVHLSDGTPARRYLQRRTDTYTVRDPRTRKTYEITQPASVETILVGLREH